MELVTNPNEFFRRRAGREPKLMTPILTIILPMSVVSGVYQYFLASKLAEAFTGDLALLFKVSAYLGVVFSLIGSFVVWLILALIMHGISAVFGGEGSFKRTLEFTGFGFLPFLIGSLITTPVALKYVLEAEVPKITVEMLKEDPDIMTTVLKAVIPDEVVYSNVVINLATLLWAVVIWSFAVKHARNLEFGKSFVAASVPAIIYGLYQIWSLMKLI